MIDVRSNMCLDCNKHASYGFKKSQYCNTHKKNGMVLIKKPTYALCLDSMNAICYDF